MQGPGYNPYAPPQGIPDPYQQIPPAHQQFRAIDFEPASLGARFVADLVDRLIVFGPAAAFAMAIGVGAAVLEGDGITEETVTVLVYVGLTVGALVGGAAQIWAQSHWAQSFGKRMLGIRVLHPNGQPPTIMSIVFARNIAILALGSMCGLVSLVDSLMIFGIQRRCLHDRIANTIVVRAT
jgi:uncharacterized RDD family membrane protein YckC